MATVEQRHKDEAIRVWNLVVAGNGLGFVAQALADAEQRGAESARYPAERAARQELWSFIRLHAGKSDTQNVSAEWLDAFAPELVSGRFADIAPTAKGEANG